MNTLRKDAAAMSLGSRGLIDRMLGSSDLAIVVPRLSPELLHRVVQRCGLEECGELLALATAEQLAGVLDLDVWHADKPGLDEEFDAERYGVWIETLVEGDTRSAAEIVSRLDVDLVAAALAHHARVFDPAAVSASMDSDGLTCEVGGYVIANRPIPGMRSSPCSRPSMPTSTSASIASCGGADGCRIPGRKSTGWTTCSRTKNKRRSTWHSIAKTAGSTSDT